MLAFAVLVLAPLPSFASSSIAPARGLGDDRADALPTDPPLHPEVRVASGAIPEGSPVLRVPQDATPSTVRTIWVLIGARALDSDFDPVDEQVALGIEYDQYSPGSIVGWEVGFSYSSDDGSVSGLGDVEAEFLEIYGGVRKTWGAGDARLHPYAGGGLSYIDVDGEVDTGAGTTSDSDFGIGLYLRGGASFDLTENLRLGVDLKILGGTDIDISDVNDGDNADYGQLSLTFGYGL